MPYSPPMTFKSALIIITIVIGIVRGQNVTDTSQLAANEIQSSTISPPLDATTIPSNPNEPVPNSLDNTASHTLEPKILQDLPLNGVEPPDISTSIEQIGVASPKVHQMPEDCSHREKLRKQPQPSQMSKIRKCCPNGETLITEDDSPNYCETQDREFAPQVIKVELYQNCIEDLEEPVKLAIEVGNPCNESFIFSASRGDLLQVIQDGSLLVMDRFANETYQIETSYCMDTDISSGELFAIVCMSSVEEHVGTGQTILYAVFMLISVPCLCGVSFLHFAIKELRSVHGLSLGVMSACLAIGFSLHTIAQLTDDKCGLGYAVQFFMLSYFFWLFGLCCNVLLHVWFYLPRNILITRTIRFVHFFSYALVAFSISFTLVMVTIHKGLPGMPSYFLQGVTESIRESQRYFIPPVTCVLFLSLAMLIASFFGFKNVNRATSQGLSYDQVYTQTTVPVPSVDQEGYQEIKKDAKCICCLFVIIMITWILEIVTFYSPGPADYIAFMEIVNGLQGVFIMMIFIIVRNRRNAIVRWYHDRGSHDVTPVTPVEMTVLNSSSDQKNGTQPNGR